MKTTLTLLASSFVIAHTAIADVAPAIPVGSINVDQLTVRQGVAPTFSWTIQYPEKVTDVIEITPEEEIIPKSKLRVKVSMVGVGITDQNNNEYPALVYMKLGSNWNFVFSGTGESVQPDNVLIDQIVQPGEAIQFAARVNTAGFGYYYHNTPNITILKNGDTPPSTAAGFDFQTDVASYLRPYVKDGLIALGPMDVIYVSELTHSDPAHFGYDQQDAITLVTFEKVED